MSVLQDLFTSIVKMSITASYVAIGVIFIRLLLKKCRRFYPIFFGLLCFSDFYVLFLLIRI
jgi:hypothetical protein